MVRYDFGLKYVTEKYLRSKEYEELMETFLDDTSDRFNLGEDLDIGKSYGFRHNNMQMIYCWKWLCIYQYRELFMEYVFSDKIGIDFGGDNGPVGGNTKIVDIRGGHATIDDIEENSLDYIFTSHCLEHIPNLDETLIKLRSKLKDDGIMLGVVPCYKCVRWRHAWFNDHRWTFSLEDDEWTRFDKKILKAGFKIKKMEYCWENAIFMLCEK